MLCNDNMSVNVIQIFHIHGPKMHLLQLLLNFLYIIIFMLVTHVVINLTTNCIVLFKNKYYLVYSSSVNMSNFSSLNKFNYHDYACKNYDISRSIHT